MNMHSIIQWGGASEREKVKEEERVSWIATWLSRLLHPVGEEPSAVVLGTELLLWP